MRAESRISGDLRFGMRSAKGSNVTTVPLDPPAPVRSLAPREHGAYGQLGVPLVAGLALGRPNLVGVCLTFAAVAAFLAHEPVLVLLGQRGNKARVQDGPRAGRRLGVLGGAAVVLGALGFVLAPMETRLAVLPPALLAAAVVWFVWRKQEKTAVGEIVAAAALSGAGLPVAMAGGVALGRAGLAWAVWTAAFLVATLAVRAVIARAKKLGSGPLVLSVVATLATLTASIGLAFSGQVPYAVPIALSPFVVMGLGVCVAPVSTKQLRRVGWALVAASVATLVILVATLRI